MSSNVRYFMRKEYMKLSAALMVAALFVALTPGVLLTLPKGGSKLTVAAVHAAVFVVVLCFVNNSLWRRCLEGFKEEEEEDFISRKRGADL